MPLNVSRNVVIQNHWSLSNFLDFEVQFHKKCAQTEKFGIVYKLGNSIIG